ncbi:hypothetical protein INR49_023190 [Caranx melampygus]|nr:hypothetical protein INR49_023190 [Caranx melampygus]
MTDKKLSSLPAPSLSSPHQNVKVGGVVPRSSPALHQNGGLEPEPGHHSPKPHSDPSSGTLGSTTSFRSLRTLGDIVNPALGCSSSSITPHTHSHGFTLSSKTRTTTIRTKCRSSQQEEPEALLDLILESQGQRLDDQRASVSLLPDVGTAALCGACSPDQPHLPSLDFYHMLIHYQSDRMEDQRCPLPDLDDVVGSVPEVRMMAMHYPMAPPPTIAVEDQGLREQGQGFTGSAAGFGWNQNPDHVDVDDSRHKPNRVKVLALLQRYD